MFHRSPEESVPSNWLQILDHKVVCSLPYRKIEPRAESGTIVPVRKVMRDVPADVTEEELCAATGAVTARRLPARHPPQETEPPAGSLRVTGANVTSAVVLTYENGKMPPAKTNLGWVKRRLQPYVPDPRRCYKCQIFGHTSKFCRKEKPVCPVCAEEHTYEDCTNKSSPKCANCSGNHSAGYRKCPKYIVIKKH